MVRVIAVSIMVVMVMVMMVRVMMLASPDILHCNVFS
jgi:hypothetical protein